MGSEAASSSCICKRPLLSHDRSRNAVLSVRTLSTSNFSLISLGAFLARTVTRKTLCLRTCMLLHCHLAGVPHGITNAETDKHNTNKDTPPMPNTVHHVVRRG